MSPGLRCQRSGCGGQIFVEPHTEPEEDGGFTGFRLTCLLCGRAYEEHPYLGVIDLLMLCGASDSMARRVRGARWSNLTFLFGTLSRMLR